MAMTPEIGLGGGGRFRRRTPRLTAEINITPLVDVMLVLLIIFMITAPMFTGGVEVDLPKTGAPALSPTKDPLIITVRATGEIYVSETAVPREDLVGLLYSMSGANKDIKIHLRGDQTLSYGAIMDIMALLSQAGYQKVALLAEPRPVPSVGQKPPKKSSKG